MNNAERLRADGHDDAYVAAEAAAMVLAEETLSIATPWAAYRRVRIAKRVITEIRTVQIELRREELVIDDLPVGDADRSGDRLPTGRTPIVVTLCEEQVRVERDVVPYEIVRVVVAEMTDAAQVRAEVRSEKAAVAGPSNDDPGAPASLAGGVSPECGVTTRNEQRSETTW